MELQVQQMYQKSLKLQFEEKIEYLEKLLVICEDIDQPFYGYLTRFELMREYKVAGKDYRAILLYLENINLYLTHKFSSKPLLDEFPWAAGHIDSILDIQQKEINDFFEHMRRIYEINSYSLRCFYQEYYNYLMRIGKWEEGFTIYSRWMVEARDDVSQSIAKEEADRAFYYFTVGDYENGKYVFETVKKGVKSSQGTRKYAYPRAAKYYLELKDWEMLSYLIQSGYQFNKDGLDSAEEVAELLKPLAILNPKIAFKLWKKNKYKFNQTENQRAKYAYGVATYLLEKTLSSQIANTKTLKKMNATIQEMYDIQGWMDERNATDAYHEELMYWVQIWDNFNRALTKENNAGNSAN